VTAAVSASKTKSRYSRGVRKLNPVFASGILALIEKNPDISNAEIARRLACSRQTIVLYRREMKEELDKLVARNRDVRDTIAFSQLDLRARVEATEREISQDINDVRSGSLDPMTGAAVFRGHGARRQIQQLLGELTGELKAPTTNVYLAKFDAFVSGEVGASELPKSLRAVVEGEGSGASTVEPSELQGEGP
jgi:biotin operon repressor